MAQYTYDPTQGKVVPVSQARVVTYITDNPDGMPATPLTPLKDYNATSTAGDELLKKQAAKAAASTPAAIAAAAIKAADVAVADAKAKSVAAAKAAAANKGVGPDAKVDQATAVTAAQALKEVTAAAKEIRINADPTVIAAKANQTAAAGEVTATKKSLAEALAALEAFGNAQNDGPQLEVTQALLDATKGLDTNVGLSTGATGAAEAVAAAAGTPVVSNVPKQPGTAWIWDGTKWVKPDMPKSDKSMIWDDNLGWREATTADVAASESGTATAEGGDGDGDGADAPPGIVIPPQPGDAFVYDSATNTWVRPPKPEGPGYSWDDNNGWFVTTVAPGPTGSQVGSDKVYATDTFKNTFALLFGAKEANEPYVNKLYELTSGFYKTGSTQEEAMNLAIRQAYNDNVIPEFTKRFAGIFALDAKLKAGEAITVPTIAEFFAAEAKMGTVLTEAGLGDLATQEFLGDVIGRGKSVVEVGNLISEAFNTIDNAPQALKATLSKYYPSADRVSLAKAMLMGPEGAAALEKKIKGISVLSASETQGVGTSLEQASDIAAMGYTYNQSLVGFGEVNKLKRAGELAQIGRTNFTQQQAQNAVFAKNAKDLAEIDRLDELEKSRFGGKAGNLGSKSFASQTRGMLY